jgi:ABC-type antimicrobial peptide transport system permease subunit
MALGASRPVVLQLVLREALQVTLLGMLLGVIAALALSRLMSSYVYGITATDPLTLSAASLLLFGVSLFASYLPAWRATRVNPISALRYE